MHGSKSQNILKYSLLAATILSAPGLAHAADVADATHAGNQLEEVVVTARRQAENLQSTPVAVTAITPEAFKKAGVFETMKLGQIVPGLRITSSVSDRNNIIFNIRGQGIAYGTLFPAVIPYFAEVAIPNNFSNGNFFDLESVQILRGPQGVQFGRVTDGGNVLVEPKHPTNDYEGYVEFKAGDYRMYGGSGAINIPIVTDKVLLRVSGEFARRRGFTQNIFNGKYLDGVSYETGRVSLTLRPLEGLENYTVFQINDSHDSGTSTHIAGVNPAAVANTTAGLFGGLGFAYTGLLGPGIPLTTANFITALQNQVALNNAIGPRKANLSVPIFDKRRNQYMVNKTTFDVNENLSIRNIAGWLKIKDRESSDYDGSTVAYIDTTHDFLPFYSQEQLSDELQIHGKALDSKLTYTLGVYADYQHAPGPFENYTVNLGILQRDGVQYTTSRSKAAYGQAEYDLSDVVPGLKINGGLRYTQDKVHTKEVTYLALVANPFIPEPPIPHGQCVDYTSNALGSAHCLTFDQKFHATTYTFGASDQITPDQFVYVKYSKGYRPGGTNATSPGSSNAQYQPEFDKSLEFGIKSDWNLGSDIKARTNIAAYRDIYSNIQKNVTLVGPGGAPTSIIANVAKAKIQGIELEGTLLPLPGLNLGLKYSYTDAHFKNPGDVPDAILFGDGKVTPVNGAGVCNPKAFATLGFCYLNRVAQTPKNQMTFDAHYTVQTDDHFGELTFGGEIYHQSSIALQDTSILNPDNTEPAYTLINLDASWVHPMGSPVELRAFITNVTNKLYRVGGNSLSNNGSVGINSNVYAPPRMFGGSVTYRFGG